MWVFGYGSLMWDKWQEGKHCIRVQKARLVGYRRSLNKASISNWGTKTSPCPTLNVVKQNGAFCEGLAFEFSDDSQHEILSYLRSREGKSFELQKHKIVFDSGDHLEAYVPVYVGKSLLQKDNEELLNMALQTVGTKGQCKDYIENLVAKLEELKI